MGEAAHCHTGEQTTGEKSHTQFNLQENMQSGYIHTLWSSLLHLKVSYVSSFLQCYKSSKDTCPYVDLPLPQCTVVYAPKDSKRKHHELRFTLPNGDALVLAVQSKEQAHRWLRVSYTLVCLHAGIQNENAAVNLVDSHWKWV